MVLQVINDTARIFTRFAEFELIVIIFPVATRANVIFPVDEFNVTALATVEFESVALRTAKVPLLTLATVELENDALANVVVLLTIFATVMLAIETFDVPTVCLVILAVEVFNNPTLAFVVVVNVANIEVA